VLPVQFKGGQPAADDRYYTAAEFLVCARFMGGIVMDIRHYPENGVKFEGTSGKVFVTRVRIDLEGGAVLASPLGPASWPCTGAACGCSSAA
jgi:hypothetical protein